MAGKSLMSLSSTVVFTTCLWSQPTAWRSCPMLTRACLVCSSTPATNSPFACIANTINTNSPSLSCHLQAQLAGNIQGLPPLHQDGRTVSAKGLRTCSSCNCNFFHQLWHHVLSLKRVSWFLDQYQQDLSKKCKIPAIGKSLARWGMNFTRHPSSRHIANIYTVTY